jgi:hypothetical protein
LPPGRRVKSITGASCVVGSDVSFAVLISTLSVPSSVKPSMPTRAADPLAVIAM